MMYPVLQVRASEYTKHVVFQCTPTTPGRPMPFDGSASATAHLIRGRDVSSRGSALSHQFLTLLRVLLLDKRGVPFRGCRNGSSPPPTGFRYSNLPAKSYKALQSARWGSKSYPRHDGVHFLQAVFVLMNPKQLAGPCLPPLSCSSPL